MRTTLCETFRSLAFRTFDQLGRARRVGHQPLEETFTDVNILELKDRHPKEIYCHSFNKRQEGVNGADWEWWLIDKSMSRFLGLRVQAKVLHLRTDTFRHLHFRPRKGRALQTIKFKRECAKEGLVPLYCFYLHHPELSSLQSCGSFAYAPESYGCALAPLGHIESLQNNGEADDLASVAAGIHPWHCLVCCSAYGGVSLPDRAWSLLQAAFGVTTPRRRQSRNQELGVGRRDVGPRSRYQVPSYVHAILERQEPEALPNSVRGIIVIAESEGD